MILRSRKNWSDDRKIKKLYKTAFPKCERKPYAIIRSMNRRGVADMWMIEEDGEFVGLALTMNKDDIVLLDYFAVDPDKRNAGYGAKALQMLHKIYQDRRFILEVELSEVPGKEEDKAGGPDGICGEIMQGKTQVNSEQTAQEQGAPGQVVQEQVIQDRTTPAQGTQEQVVQDRATSAQGTQEQVVQDRAISAQGTQEQVIQDQATSREVIAQTLSKLPHEELQLRRRRKAFYLRNGMSEVGICVCLFGVDMEVLGKDCTVTFDEYREIYIRCMDRRLASRVIQTI